MRLASFLYRLRFTFGATIAFSLLLQYQIVKAGEAQDLFRQAYQSYQQQQWAEALLPLEQALAQYPGYAEAHHLLGLLYSKQDKLDPAIQEFRRAVEAYPTFAQALLDLGYTYQQASRHQEAEQAFQQALDAYPEFLESRMALASLYDHLPDPTKAIAAHQAVLALQPTQADSLYGIAFWLLQEGKLKEAQPYVDRLLAASPSHVNGWIMAGSIAQQTDHLDQAIHAYQQAVSLQSELEQPYFSLGMLYQQKEEYDRAAQAFENVTRLDPKNAEAHMNLGVVLASLSKVNEAEKAYRAALALNPNLAEGYYNLGVLYEFHHHAPQKALEAYRTYVKLGGQDERILKLLQRTTP